MRSHTLLNAANGRILSPALRAFLGLTTRTLHRVGALDISTGSWALANQGRRFPPFEQPITEELLAQTSEALAGMPVDSLFPQQARGFHAHRLSTRAPACGQRRTCQNHEHRDPRDWIGERDAVLQ